MKITLWGEKLGEKIGLNGDTFSSSVKLKVRLVLYWVVGNKVSLLLLFFLSYIYISSLCMLPNITLIKTYFSIKINFRKWVP